MDNRTITALYENRTEAELARTRLIEVGLTTDQISLRDDASTGPTGYTTSDKSEGFWASLKDLFVPDEDRYTYAEGIRRGGVLLSAHVPESLVDTAVHTLETTSAVDLESRTEEWKRAGWSDYGTARSTMTSSSDLDIASTAAMAPVPPEATAVPMVGGTSTATGMRTAGLSATGSTSTATTGYTASTDIAAGREEAIPIVEEQLRVGKREVSRGSVRIRSYVVETPVEESVRLRDESVFVERRSVDLPLSAADVDPFKERTIEVTETDEEAVVSKTARVKEELVIRKDVAEHTETVRDSVRHTEVEVDDTREQRVAATSVEVDVEGRRPSDPLRK